MWSYCSQIQRRQPRSGPPSNSSSAAAWGRRGNAGSGGRRRRRGPGAVVFDPGGKRRDRHVRDLASAGAQHETARVGDAAHGGEIEVPFLEHRAGAVLGARAQRHQHAFLAFREHEFVRGHLRLARRRAIEVEIEAGAGARRHFHRRGGETRGAHVLDADHRVARHQFETGFEEELFRERVADLDGGTALLAAAPEGLGGHGRPVDAVAPGLRADIDDRPARLPRGGAKQAVGGRDSHRHRVDEDIAVIARVERTFAAHRRHADAVAVAGDPSHRAGDEVAGLRVVGRAESQTVEKRDRARAHGEHVAQNTADAGRRPLIRLDIRRVVVALHLEDGDEAAANVHRAGVLARPLDHPRRVRRQPGEPFPRRFVGTMLAPHRREHAELGEVRLAPERGADSVVFLAGQPVRLGRGGVDRGHNAASRPAKKRAPSPPPSAGSAARSGCGIMPRTRRPGPNTPAMFARDPFGAVPA